MTKITQENVNFMNYRYEAVITDYKNWSDANVEIVLESANNFVEKVDVELYGNKIVAWSTWVLRNYRWAQEVSQKLTEELKTRGVIERNEDEFIWED